MEMEWNSKLPSWGFAELEQNAELINMGSLVRSSSGQGSQSSGMDCSVDLKLGGLDGFRPPEKWKSRPTTSTVAVSSVRSKRARVLGNAGQTASCSVDGCTSDLSHSREYHRRHKVCELHSKTPIVMVGGQEQRFCQQCSRFHLLMEFDEEKRSCRKRLDGHNRRRRKPQPDSISPGSLYPNHKDSWFSAYPHALPTPLHELNWAGIIHTENTLYTNRLPLQVLDNQQNFSCSFCSCKKEKQFPFLQDDTAAFGITTGQSTFQPLKNVSSAESSSCSSKIFSNGILQVHSDCALSLLSSPTQNPGIAMDQVLPAAGFSCSGAKDEELGTVFVCNSETNLHCQSLFHVGEGPSDGIPQCHPLSWHFGSDPC